MNNTHHCKLAFLPFPLFHVVISTVFKISKASTCISTCICGTCCRYWFQLTGEWKRLLNEELNDLYSSPNIVRVIKSRRMRWAGHVARVGEERGAYRVLVGKPEGNRPLGRPKRRWVDNIRMDLQEVGCGYVDWIGLAQDRDRWRRFVSAVMNFRVL